jgi:hypothetical protein
MGGIWVSPDDSLDPADVELPPCARVSGQRPAHTSVVNRLYVAGFRRVLAFYLVRA